MIPIEAQDIRTIYMLEISRRPRLSQRELLPPVVARAKRKIIDHFRAKAEESRQLETNKKGGLQC